MTTKYSQSPWTYDGSFIKCADGELLHNVDRPYYEAEANAKLIAASPELLEVLRECGKYFDEIRPINNPVGEELYATWLKTKAVIKKATE